MNLKDFKKVHEDEHKAVLQNKKGHSFTIAKKSLEKNHLDSLKALPLHAAEGALVDDNAISQQSAPAEPETPGAPAPIAQAIAEEPLQPQADPQPTANPEQDFQNSYNQTFAQHAQDFGQEAAMFEQDRRSGHITPETIHSLYGKKDTLGKIGTLFGLLVSGAGSGLSHQPNAVLQMMQKEIDNDLDAQKTSKTNAQNFFKLSMENELNKANVGLKGAEKQGLLQDAKIKSITSAHNAALLGAYYHAEDVANKLPPGGTQQRAQQILGGLGQAVQSKIQQNNIQGAKALVDDPEGQFRARQNSLKAQTMLGDTGATTVMGEEAQRHVPGFGDASIPVPGEIRQELIAKKEYDQAARQYIDFAKQHQANWANLNPKERLEIARKGAVLGAELQGKYRLKTHGGVYKEGEQHFISTIIPDNAASWQASFNQIPRVEQTIKDNVQDTQNLAKGYGLEAPKFYKGKYYTRGKNGEAVEVK